jgi:hypothetical protein
VASAVLDVLLRSIRSGRSYVPTAPANPSRAADVKAGRMAAALWREHDGSRPTAAPILHWHSRRDL